MALPGHHGQHLASWLLEGLWQRAGDQSRRLSWNSASLGASGSIRGARRSSLWARTRRVSAAQRLRPTFAGHLPCLALCLACSTLAAAVDVLQPDRLQCIATLPRPCAPQPRLPGSTWVEQSHWTTLLLATLFGVQANDGRQLSDLALSRCLQYVEELWKRKQR
jgi:hypothetical protein